MYMYIHVHVDYMYIHVVGSSGFLLHVHVVHTTTDQYGRVGNKGECNQGGVALHSPGCTPDNLRQPGI